MESSKQAPKRLSVLVIDEASGRAAEICDGLSAAGYQVAALMPDTLDLSHRVEQLRPDVILIETDSPSRDTLEHLAVLGRDMPRPVLMFAKDPDNLLMREAMRAGVSAYVVDGLKTERLQPLIEVAMARFDEYRRLREERDEAMRKLSDRIAVDRAKRVLMQARGLDEEAAHTALRKLAMDRGVSLGVAADDVLTMAKMLL